MTAPTGVGPVGVQPGNRWVGGVMLILIGVLALAGQLLPGEWLALWLVPLLGVMFAIWGLMARQVGFLIPAGVLIGVGAGVLLMRYWSLPDNSTTTSALFMFTMAAGWALITVLALFLRRFVWWPLIVAAILALVGGGLLVGGVALTVLEVVGKLWPLILIAIGGYWLYKIYTRRAL